MSLLGLDIGSSSCKGVAFSNGGALLAEASRSYATVNPQADFCEIDPGEFWNAVVAVTRSIAERTESDPVEALAISSHGETFVCLDGEGRALGNAIMNSDNRARLESLWWNSTFPPERTYRICGAPSHPMFPLDKILWLRKNREDLFRLARLFVSAGDYILTRMGFAPCTDHSLASRTGMFDIEKRDWSDDILSHAGIGRERLPVPLPAGETVGRLPKAAAGILSLREGIPVALGGHDQPCGAFGAGVIDQGEVSDSAGTYECLAAVSSRPGNTARALAYGLNSYCHVVPDRYVTLAFFPAGIVSRWFLDRFCFEDGLCAGESGTTIFEAMEKGVEALGPEPTGILVTPHLVGSCNPHWDSDAAGAIVGLKAHMTRHHLYKAIHEGIACELACNIEALEEVVGPFPSVRIFGGNAKSPFSLGLRADITRKEMVTLPIAESVCLGAAMLAGIAAGVYRNHADAVAKAVHTRGTVSPDSGDRYGKQRERYKRLYGSLEWTWKGEPTAAKERIEGEAT
jgi:xylulokinase